MMWRNLVVTLALTGCGVGVDNPVVEDPIVEPPGGGDPVGETPGLRPALPVSGARSASGPLVTIDGELEVLVVDQDNESIDRFRSESSGSVPVEGEPTRLVAIGDTVWVTLRRTGELARLSRRSGGQMVEEDRVRVGTEPYDVVAAQFADRLYVSLSQEDAVIALDARTLEVVGRWHVPGEPKWMVAIPTGVDGVERLMVASARLARVTIIEPLTGKTTVVPIANLQGADLGADAAPIELFPRISGGLGVDEAGIVYVPVLYADTDLSRAAGEPPRPDVPEGEDPNADGTTSSPPSGGVSDTGMNFPGEPPREGGCGDPSSEGGAYGSPVDPNCKDPGSVGRFTPVLIAIDPAVGGAVDAPIAVGAVVNGTDRAARGYVSDVRLTRDPSMGRVAWVSMPTEGAVIGVALDADTRPMEVEESIKLRFPMRVGLPAPHGVTGSLVSSGGAAIVSWGITDRVVSVQESAFFLQPDVGMGGGAAPGSISGSAVTQAAPPSRLSAELQEGRRLFMSANDSRMAVKSSGVSCDTCHADGRNDGFTWRFEDMPRQTPNLAGHVSDTLPITWLGNVATVVDEVFATTSDRMGGEGLDHVSASAVAAWVDAQRAIQRPQPVTEDQLAQVARGKALFQRGDVGCATCHSGTVYADGQNWAVMGFNAPTNTPSLRGIGGSAPFLHDGSAASLRDVLVRAKDGSMGNTGSLSDAELDDLEAYLKTL